MNILPAEGSHDCTVDVKDYDLDGHHRFVCVCIEKDY